MVFTHVAALLRIVHFVSRAPWGFLCTPPCRHVIVRQWFQVKQTNYCFKAHTNFCPRMLFSDVQLFPTLFLTQRHWNGTSLIFLGINLCTILKLEKNNITSKKREKIWLQMVSHQYRYGFNFNFIKNSINAKLTPILKSLCKNL